MYNIHNWGIRVKEKENVSYNPVVLDESQAPWYDRSQGSRHQNGIFCRSAAAAAKSLQLCPTLCNPIDGSPPGSCVHGILQARVLEWVAIAYSNALK